MAGTSKPRPATRTPNFFLIKDTSSIKFDRNHRSRASVPAVREIASTLRTENYLDNALVHSCHPMVEMGIEIKKIGSNGQISLGRENAGRTVMVERIDEGVWLIKSARVIPESERWLHTPGTADTLSRSIRWA